MLSTRGHDPRADRADLPRVPWTRDRVVETIDWRPPVGVTIISADDHVLEPAGLWQDRLDPPDERAPVLWDDEAGNRHFQVGDRDMDLFGLDPQNVEGHPGFRDQGQRLADMDAEGIATSVIYPQKTFGAYSLKDKDLTVRCIDVYNEWLSEFCAAAPGRFVGVGLLPTMWRPESTTDYLDKLKDLGFRSVMLPMSMRGLDIAGDDMDIVWSAIEESGLPVSFHVSEFVIDRGRGFVGAFLTGTFQTFPDLFAKLAFGGVFDRHPEVQVVFAEGGLGWVPVALQNADRVARAFESDLNPRLGHLPSHYWHRQCWATFMDDPVGVRSIDDVGIERAMWSVDYPHPESVFGESRSIMRGLFEDLGDERARAVVSDNAKRLYRLD